LKSAAKQLGSAAEDEDDDEELRGMIEEFDLDGDGRIGLPEFERILLGYEDEVEC
jgi:Ca2+-binding EF-hand superfamily protein